MHFADHQPSLNTGVSVNPGLGFFSRGSAQNKKPCDVGITAEWPCGHRLTRLQQSDNIPQVLMKNLISLSLWHRVPFRPLLDYRHLKLHHLVLLREGNG